MKQVYVGSTPVRQVYVGSKMVWSATVKITATSGLEARDQFRQALNDRGFHYSVITEVPFDLDTSGSTTMQDMFRNCYALTTIPEMDTSQVTNMQDMFSECRALTHVPDMDTGQVTNMRGMFHNCNSMTHAPALNTPQVVDSAYMFTKCSSLVHVPDMDASKNTDLYAMFMDTPALTDGNVRLIGRHPAVNPNTIGMLQNSGLTREPWYTREGEQAVFYETNFNFGQTGTVDLAGNDGWIHYAASSRVLRVESDYEVVPSTTTSDGTYTPQAIRSTGTASDHQAVTIRWSEPWESVDASGLVIASDNAYDHANSSRFFFWAKSGDASFRTFTNNEYTFRKSYTGAEPAVGDDFTVTREVSGTTQTYTVYINGVYQDHWVDTEQLVPIGTGNRRYGLFTQLRRALWSNHFGPRINYFKVHDF